MVDYISFSRQNDLSINFQVFTHLDENEGALLDQNVDQKNGKNADEDGAECHDVHCFSAEHVLDAVREEEDDLLPE